MTTIQPIIISKVQCNRCLYSWVPRKAEIKVCPSCKSPYWNKERVRPVTKKSNIVL